MFDDLKIRSKLILLMAGPIVIILMLSALGAQDRRASASDSRQVEDLVTLARANSDVVDALQQEALYSSAFIGTDRASWSEELEAARADTDASLAAALPRLARAGGGSAAVQTAADLAVGAAEKLGPYRGTVDQGFRPDQFSELVVNYGELQNTFLAVNTNVSDTISDPQAAADLRGASALAAYKSSIAQQGALLAGAAGQGSFGSDQAFQLLQEQIRAEERQLALLNSISGLSRKGAVRDAMATDASETFTSVRTMAASAGADGALQLDAPALTEATGTVLTDLHEVETALLQQLIGSSQAARSSAERASSLFLIAAVVAMVGAALAAIVLGRRITGPLRTLTDAADHLSREQMPRLIETLKNPAEDDLGYHVGSMRPIEIESDDEIGRLARSFNEVQRVAGEVATEQAALLRKGIGEMFVNLARRNQALLDRQIEFIDELERGEEDPDQLDNLYRLDHLATRMRRNAESLLVLAGAEPPRRRGRPAPLANVVRAALAEVEDFGRIELLSFDEVLVASNAAADLAHLLSELMENATNFSPPETRVEVVGHKTKADGYVISVTDHGIGMSADQIQDSNESLAKPPLVGLAMSRSLGFIVVGRLAARHKIAVRMMPSAAGGVTAVVSIPPSLVVDTPGGMAEPEPQVQAPARLKPVLDSPTSGLAPLAFAPAADAGTAFDQAPAPAPVAPEPEIDPAGPPAPEPVAWNPEPAPAAPTSDAPELPSRSIFDVAPEGSDGPISPDTVSALDDADAEIAAQVAEAVEPAMPAALSFSAPPPPSVGGAKRLDGPPPQAPSTSRPFFLEDAAPPRPFGQDPAPSGSSAAAAPLAPAAAPKAPRLFGGPVPVPPASEPATEPAEPTSDPAPPEVATVAPSTPESAPEALPTRSTEQKLDGAPPLVARRPGARAPEASPAAPAPAPDPAPAAPAPEAAATTSSGLAKRVPRSAGATRAIPGSETERGVGATKRSPEEIRKMLSQHTAGRQRARATEPVPAGAPEETQAHE